jgi:hypothetical protein
MEDDNDSAIITILDHKLNIQQYKKEPMDKKMLNPSKLFAHPLLVLVHQTSVPYDVLEQIVGVVAESMVPEVVPWRSSTPRLRFNDPILVAF